MRQPLLLTLCLAATATFAPAATLNISGDTSTSPVTWNRPTEGAPPTLTSIFGATVPYVSFGFTVDAGGDYTFEVQLPAFDTFIVLFQDPFDPLDPLNNAIAAVDEGPLTASLLSAVPYTFIVTGYFDEDFGPFDASISGPGNILPTDSAVPEPATWTMVVLSSILLFARRTFRVHRIAMPAMTKMIRDRMEIR
jgi:hypothetical protein